MHLPRVGQWGGGNGKGAGLQPGGGLKQPLERRLCARKVNGQHFDQRPPCVMLHGYNTIYQYQTIYISTFLQMP